ncbi:hypothetical protein [Micromonospora sonchi]|nr:hypothetical protein [Micromonospora sonchi]
MAAAKRRAEESGRDDARERLYLIRATYVSAVVALLAVVLLAFLGGCSEAEGTATAGMAAVGAIMTAAFGVAAAYARSKR